LWLGNNPIGGNIMKTSRIEIKVSEAQKELLQKLADKQGITVTEYIMRGLYTKLTSDNVILPFLNSESIDV
jgi:uncharacterized protein (DUF1778 family)